MNESVVGNSQANEAGDVGRLGSVVRSSLISSGFSKELADKYSLHAVQVYKWLRGHPEAFEVVKAVRDSKDVYEGTK